MQNGLYKHYKNKNLYRLLFTATWRWPDEFEAKGLANDDLIYVDIRNSISSPLLSASPLPHWNSDYSILIARWSGNAIPKDNDKLAIYVAIYDEGRIAARSLDEFNGTVEYEGATVQRFQLVE